MSSSSLLPTKEQFKTTSVGFEQVLMQEMAAPKNRPSLQEDDDVTPGRPRMRAIFISDLHIGTPGFQAEALLDFL